MQDQGEVHEVAHDEQMVDAGPTTIDKLQVFQGGAGEAGLPGACWA